MEELGRISRRAWSGRALNTRQLNFQPNGGRPPK